MSDENVPVRVLHLRNVTSEVTQADIMEAARQFGNVEKIVMLKTKHQAMVQFSTVARPPPSSTTMPSTTCASASAPSTPATRATRRLHLFAYNTQHTNTQMKSLTPTATPHRSGRTGSSS